MQFNSKFVIVVAEDLPVWQKLNVVSFLSGGITSTSAVQTGERYVDGSDNTYLPLCIQPTIVLKVKRSKLPTFIQRAHRANIETAIFIDDMFETGHDEANRGTVRSYDTERLPLVGIALCAEKKLVDKIVKGAKLHD
ncbi:hypothetical protein VII00023_10899 [Vibrio ichthyoenteri ATCC 700023]|uniref:DUF2000 domain-containing protein n=1 Tax=Vibrio ichthyoenteri ATCC 700023 TaxID=870968 RepID=F9S835_9VIBR|nr:DUF2000 family protein [Vibrio ichthyoenteri]EGU30512.1 hypothetical protein VII00023_10899 [Vibrio ichthyoenteri ATCC 700023]